MTEVSTDSITPVRQLMEDYAAPTLVMITDPKTGAQAPVLVHAKHLEVKPAKAFTDAVRDRPERISGAAQMDTLESFIAHSQRFRLENSALFARASMDAPQLLTVFDYHDMVPNGGDAFLTPRADWAGHRCTYAFPLSEEWKAWAEKDGKLFDQGEFAAFIEDRIVDVLFTKDKESLPADLKRYLDVLGGEVAGPSTLVALSRGLKVTENAQVQGAVNLSSGESTIAFVAEHRDEAGGKLTVPNLFAVAIPVFQGGPLYKLAVRLRYRVAGGRVKWFYELYRTRETFDHAFGEAAQRAATETELPLFFGAPEA